MHDRLPAFAAAQFILLLLLLRLGLINQIIPTMMHRSE